MSESKERGPIINFKGMGIPIDSILKYTDGEATAQTIDEERRILFRGTPTYLHPATTKLLGRKPSHPCRYWTYNGMLLSDLWEKYRDAMQRGR